MRGPQAHYFVALLLLITALTWLGVPGDAKLIVTPWYLLAAFCFVMAGRDKRRQ